MTYLLTLTLPVAYRADDDDHARVIAEHIEDSIMLSSLPHNAEFLEPDAFVLESGDTRLKLHTVVGPGDSVARYAPFPADTGAGHEPCPECLDYIAASRSPAGPVELDVEAIDDDDDDPEVDQPAHEVRHP